MNETELATQPAKAIAPSPVPMIVCRHCHKRKANRPRRLCWTCYYAPGVKELYPLGSATPPSGSDRPKCRHCRERKAARTCRGLCPRCYDDRAIRDQYPVKPMSERPCGNRGVSDRTGRRPLPEPTAHRPGSEGKLAELCRRAEAGLSLFHPGDAK